MQEIRVDYKGDSEQLRGLVEGVLASRSRVVAVYAAFHRGDAVREWNHRARERIHGDSNHEIDET